MNESDVFLKTPIFPIEWDGRMMYCWHKTSIKINEDYQEDKCGDLVRSLHYEIKEKEEREI